MRCPRFSVVIPTRERADTLRFALQTCLAQQFANVEIVVSDNCSSPATKEVVDALRSPLIKYIRSKTPLAMSDNFEMAVSHATGEYVIVIGDDDGLLLHALNDLDRMIQQTSARLIQWARVRYNWPDSLVTPDVLIIPINHHDAMYSATEVIRNAIKECNYEVYGQLPMLYNSAVHQDLLSELRHRTGRIFRSQIPDIYSGMALAYVADKYLSVSRPMTIDGSSGKSSGTAAVARQVESPIVQEFTGLNRAAGLHFHRLVPDFQSWPTVMTDAFLQAREALFPNERRFRFNRKHFISHCLKAAAQRPHPNRARAVDAIRASVSDDPVLLRWCEEELNSVPSGTDTSRTPGLAGRSNYLDRIRLSASDFGVADVYGAAQLCEKLCHYCERPFLWRDAGWRPNGTMSVSRRLRRAVGVLLNGR